MAEKNNPKNVSVGKPMADGAVFVAPSGTAVPTDATTPLAEAFLNVGFISEDGVTNAIETETEEIKAWGGDIVLEPQTSRKETFAYTMIETNEVSMKQAFGEENVNVGEDGSISVVHNGKEKSEYVYVIEVLMTGNRVKRQVIPRGKVTELGEIVYVDNEPIGYETTISALVDDSGNTAYEYIAAITD